MEITNGTQKIKEITVKFDDGEIKTFEEGIAIVGELEKRDSKIGYSIKALSSIPGLKAKLYYEAVKVLKNVLKEKMEKEERNFSEFKGEKDEIAKKITNDIFDRMKDDMYKYDVEMTDNLEKFLKGKTREVIENKMFIDLIEALMK